MTASSFVVRVDVVGVHQAGLLGSPPVARMACCLSGVRDDLASPYDSHTGEPTSLGANTGFEAVYRPPKLTKRQNLGQSVCVRCEIEIRGRGDALQIASGPLTQFVAVHPAPKLLTVSWHQKVSQLV